MKRQERQLSQELWRENVITSKRIMSSSQSLGSSPQAFSPTMKERIDENHQWVTEDGIMFTEASRNGHFSVGPYHIADAITKQASLSPLDIYRNTG